MMTEKENRVSLRCAFKKARIIVGENARSASLRDISGNHLLMSIGDGYDFAHLTGERAQGLPKVNNKNREKVQQMTANRLAGFVSEQSTLFFFNKSAQAFYRADMSKARLSVPELAGTEGSSNVYTVKPVFD